MIEITGRLGDAKSFTGILHISTSEMDRKPVFLTAGDLTPEDAEGSAISESRIDIMNLSEELPRNEPRAVRVTVEGVRQAGEYRGAIKLAGAKCRVGLNIDASAPLDLVLIGEGDDRAVDLEFVRCTHLTCGPEEKVDFLVSEQALRDEVAPQVDNRSQSPARVTDIQVSLAGDPGERVVPSGSVVSQSRTAVLDPWVSTLPAISVERNRLAPDHYTGSISLTVAGEDERVAFPLKIDVKDGPFWASVCSRVLAD